MNYTQTIPSSSLKQRNKSATINFQMELLLILQPGRNLALVQHQTSVILNMAVPLATTIKSSYFFLNYIFPYNGSLDKCHISAFNGLSYTYIGSY